MLGIRGTKMKYLKLVICAWLCCVNLAIATPNRPLDFDGVCYVELPDDQSVGLDSVRTIEA